MTSHFAYVELQITQIIFAIPLVFEIARLTCNVFTKNYQMSKQLSLHTQKQMQIRILLQSYLSVHCFSGNFCGSNLILGTFTVTKDTDLEIVSKEILQQSPCQPQVNRFLVEQAYISTLVTSVYGWGSLQQCCVLVILAL